MPLHTREVKREFRRIPNGQKPVDYDNDCLEWPQYANDGAKLYCIARVKKENTKLHLSVLIAGLVKDEDDEVVFFKERSHAECCQLALEESDMHYNNPSRDFRHAILEASWKDKEMTFKILEFPVIND